MATKLHTPLAHLKPGGVGGCFPDFPCADTWRNLTPLQGCRGRGFLSLLEAPLPPLHTVPAPFGWLVGRQVAEICLLPICRPSPWEGQGLCTHPPNGRARYCSERFKATPGSHFAYLAPPLGRDRPHFQQCDAARMEITPPPKNIHTHNQQMAPQSLQVSPSNLTAIPNWKTKKGGKVQMCVQEIHMFGFISGICLELSLIITFPFIFL